MTAKPARNSSGKSCRELGGSWLGSWWPSGQTAPTKDNARKQRQASTLHTGPGHQVGESLCQGLRPAASHPPLLNVIRPLPTSDGLFTTFTRKLLHLQKVGFVFLQVRTSGSRSVRLRGRTEDTSRDVFRCLGSVPIKLPIIYKQMNLFRLPG